MAILFAKTVPALQNASTSQNWLFQAQIVDVLFIGSGGRRRLSGSGERNANASQAVPWTTSGSA
jgi:hypothetical protein